MLFFFRLWELCLFVAYRAFAIAMSSIPLNCTFLVKDMATIERDETRLSKQAAVISSDPTQFTLSFPFSMSFIDRFVSLLHSFHSFFLIGTVVCRQFISTDRAGIVFF